MIIYIMIGINSILCYKICSTLFNKETFIEKIAVTFSVFMIVYAVCGGFLFAVDVFSFRNVMLVQCAVFALGIIIQTCRRRHYVQKLFVKEDKWLLIILAIGLFFYFKNSSYFQ